MERGVVFMVVALSAADGEAKPDGANGGGAVGHGFEAELLVVDAAFAVGEGVAVEAGGDALFGGGLGEEVAGDLFTGELVEGHVAIE